MAAPVENKVVDNAKDNANEKKEGVESDDVYIAEVTHLYNKAGAGGDINLVRVLLKHNNRSITRSVQGPVRVGDLISLRECVRESRRSR